MKRPKTLILTTALLLAMSLESAISSTAEETEIILEETISDLEETETQETELQETQFNTSTDSPDTEASVISIEEIEIIDESQIPDAVSADDDSAAMKSLTFDEATDNASDNASGEDGNADNEADIENTATTVLTENGITGEAAFTTASGGISLASEDSDTTCSLGVTVTYGQTTARTMLDMINELRTGDDAWYWNSDDTTKTVCSGLSELTYDYDLEAIAMQRAAEIALYYSHTRPDGNTCWTAYDDNSYSYWACGENIAAGYTSAASVFTGWAEEDESYSGQGHRRNMLNSNFTSVGIGHVYYNGIHYWVQEFAYPTSTSGSSTTANDSSTNVSVNVLSENISSVSLSADPDTCSLIVGESAALPSLTVKVTLTETWPSGRMQTVTTDYSWASANSSCASISENMISGLAAGTTSISTSALGETLSVPVAVQYDITKANLSLSSDSFTYSGSAQTPTVTVKYESATLTSGTDYTVTYADNTNAGTASVTVTGTGNYTGSLTRTFTIEKANLSSASVSLGQTSCTCDGKAKTPSVTVKCSSSTLTGGTDYTTSYSDNTNPGTATVTITGTGNYTGTASASFQITLASGKITSLENKAKGVTIKWNQVSGASGYYISRKTASGSYQAVKTIKSGSTVSYT
ncbi:MAG: CAP domain-containing protein, partial [Clostridiales bacterium]|nr:CAP domain-containing protein [Clostridiales bacterium]